MLKIEAVTVCVNYSDFLEHSLPENLQHVDRMVVVSHPDDKNTKRLCDYYGVDCLQTEVMHEDRDAFNKGRAINLGLSHLRHDGWLIHLDADIVLPHRFRPMLDHAKLDPTCIYGADRLNVKSFENWEAHKHKRIPQHRHRFLVDAISEFRLGSRLLHQEYHWLPIGLFQLWNASMKRNYPINTGSAEHSDVLFSAQWPRNKRILLPEFFVYHLETFSNFGENWNGRKSAQFGHKPKDSKPVTY